MERSEAEYNNLKKIDHLRHEVITDKSLSYHDALFKVIVIGDSGKLVTSIRNLLAALSFQSEVSESVPIRKFH